MRHLMEQCNHDHKLGSLRESGECSKLRLVPGKKKIAFELGKPAPVHALTKEIADPSCLGAHESASGEFGPTASEKAPQTS